jgi:hypothetical protein
VNLGLLLVLEAVQGRGIGAAAHRSIESEVIVLVTTL